MTKKIIYTIVSILITATLVVYFLKNHSISDIKNAILNVPLIYISSFLIFSLSMSIFRTWRYKLLLNVNGYNVPATSLFLVTIVRNLFADLLPARIGTLIYVFLLKTRLGIPLDGATSSFAYSFVFDIFAMIPIIFFILLFFTVPEEIPISSIIQFSFILLLICLFIVYTLPWWVSQSKKILLYIISGNNNIILLLKQIENALAEIKNANIFDRIVVLSILIRISKYSALYIFLVGLGVSLNIDSDVMKFSTSMIGLITAELAASLPTSGIAGFGAYEGAWVFTFSLLGLERRLAEITGITHHLFTQAYGYSFGILCLVILMFPMLFIKEQIKKEVALKSTFSFYRSIILISTFMLILGLFPLVLKASDNRSAEVKSEQVIQWKSGQNLPEIIFDSNREVVFGIYGLDTDNDKIYRIVNTEEHEMFPSVSPDNKYIAFSRHKTLSRTGKSDIIVFSTEDGNESVIENGVYPVFSNDGKSLFFERNRNSVMEFNLSTAKLSKLFPSPDFPDFPDFGSYQVVKPRLSKDNKGLVFTSDKGGRWHAWFANLQTNELINLGRGCEPVIHPQKNKIIWVSEKNVKEGSGFFYYLPETQERGVFYDQDAPWGHEYFPSFSKDGKYLYYSASPPGQHSHETANYQIFKLDTSTKERTKLTNDNHTNRWPKAISKND